MSGDTYYLRWPPGRGVFRETDADRSPTGEPEKFPPGRVVETDDVHVRDHYVDRGWEDIPPEDADQIEEPEEAKLTWDDFANRGYQKRVAAVEGGDADHFLQRVYDDDGSVTVRDAVEARADEVGVDLDGRDDDGDGSADGSSDDSADDGGDGE